MYNPSNKILKHLYTNGKELISKSTKKEYKGYYIKNSSGHFFSEISPFDELIPVDKKFIIEDKFMKPYYNSTIPTEKDYNNKEFIRYFCKKINENIYVEIDKIMYNNIINLKNKNNVLYFPFYINWYLTGDKDEVTLKNKNNIKLIINKYFLEGFDEYINFNYTKYYK